MAAGPTEAPLRHRFRPRFRALAWCALLLGASFLAAALLLADPGGATRPFAIGCGATGLLLGALYLLSPAWRIEVFVDDEALEVRSRGDRRFRLPWCEVVRIWASPTTSTCFVDGGSPERSLLVPGPGASAPYDIENKQALYRAILARAPAHTVRTVDLLEQAPGQG
jgi:hypothetical protein